MSLGCERHRRGEFDSGGDRFTDSRGGRYGLPDSTEPDSTEPDGGELDGGELDGVRRRRNGNRYGHGHGGIAGDHGRRAGACRRRRGSR